MSKDTKASISFHELCYIIIFRENIVFTMSNLCSIFK